MPIRVDAVLTGRSLPFRGADEPSAIAKHPVTGEIAVGPFGLEGDEQADRINHGGPEKAIHHYPRDHYARWREEIGSHSLLDQYGAFGENVSTLGLTEGDLCIGDRFRLGTSLVEVSQGRQPCWKLGHRFGNSKITARVVSTGRSGWYYRVIEPGNIKAGDTIQLAERRYDQWTVALVFKLLIGGEGKEQPHLVEQLARLDALAESWRTRAQKMVRSV